MSRRRNTTSPVVEHRHTRRQPAAPPLPKQLNGGAHRHASPDRSISVVHYDDQGRAMRSYRETGIEHRSPADWWPDALDVELDSLGFERAPSSGRIGHNNGPSLPRKYTKAQRESAEYAAAGRGVSRAVKEIHAYPKQRAVRLVAFNAHLYKILLWCASRCAPRLKVITHDDANVAPSYMDGRSGSHARYLKSLK
jgi:hypothetical protein